jgi:hypothetical protein
MWLFMSLVLIVVRFVLFLLSFDFLKEQSYCSELVVMMFHAVYFCVFRSGFLYFMGSSTFRVSTSRFVICQIATHFMLPLHLRNEVKAKSEVPDFWDVTTYYLIDTVMYRSIARQRLDKHVPTETDFL